MFRSEDKAINPEPTPERIYQCALYLAENDGGMTKNEFRKAMAMPEIFGDKSEKIFEEAYKVFRELELCTEKDGKIYPSEALRGLKNVGDFRRYCARFIFQFTDSIFFQVTSMYCEYAEEMMKVRKWDDVNMFMGQRALLFHPNVLKGWRLWAPFLGCGYLNEYFMIPNWAQRIADLLTDQTAFKVNEEIPIETFMNWLLINAPEIRNSIKGKQIGMAVSNALMTLNELKILQTIYTPDALLWQLAETGGLNRISHVKIVG